MSQFPEMGQPGGPGGFGNVPPGYPQPRKSRWWLWILLGLGGMAGLICCGCAGLSYFGLSAAGSILDQEMVKRLNNDDVAKERLGEVKSAKWDMMATGRASKNGETVLVFHVEGEKGKADVHADQAPGEKGFENARLVMPGGEEVPLGF